MAQGYAAYAVSSDGRLHLPGLPLALAGHVTTPIVPVGFPGVMRLAPETQVDCGVRAGFRPRMYVPKLKTAALVAAVTVYADKTAAPSSRVHTSRLTAHSR